MEPPRTFAPDGRNERTQRRILGVDVARALAIVGMFAVHVGPSRGADLNERLYALSHGRASVLFVMVAGIGVSILMRSRRATPAHAVQDLAWRAAILLPAGLILQELDHRVFVILQSYAPLFLLAILAVRLPARLLLAAAAVLALAGPAVYLSGVLFDPGTFDRDPVRWAGIGEILHGLVLSGPYPLVVWSAPFLLGMAIGTRDLRSRRVQRTLVLGGAVAVVLAYGVAWTAARAIAPDGASGWMNLLDVTPHSQMPPWLVGSSGSAALVLGVSLMVAQRWPESVWPLAALGQVALTVYVAHLLALHAWTGPLRSDDVVRATAVVTGFTSTAAGAAVAWRAWSRRGPLEMLLRYPSILRSPPGER